MLLLLLLPVCLLHTLLYLLFDPTVRMRNMLKEMTHTQRCTAVLANWPNALNHPRLLRLPYRPPPHPPAYAPCCSAAPNVR